MILLLFVDTKSTAIYTLSLHDALPISATYRHYTQYVDGVPVLGGEVIERVDADGSVHEVYRALARHQDPSPAERKGMADGRVRVNINGEARPARRIIIEERPHERVARYVDEHTGAV